MAYALTQLWPCEGERWGKNLRARLDELDDGAELEAGWARELKLNRYADPDALTHVDRWLTAICEVYAVAHDAVDELCSFP